jgi:hypothetical protein
VVLSGYSGFLYHYNWFHDIAHSLIYNALIVIKVQCMYNVLIVIKVQNQEEKGRVDCPKYYLGFGYGVHQYFNYIVVVFYWLRKSDHPEKPIDLPQVYCA